MLKASRRRRYAVAGTVGLERVGGLMREDSRRGGEGLVAVSASSAKSSLHCLQEWRNPCIRAKMAQMPSNPKASWKVGRGAGSPLGDSQEVAVGAAWL